MSSYRMTRHLSCAAAALVALGVVGTPLAAAPEDDVAVTFDRFVAAQNAHDPDAVEALLLDSPDFLWITRGNPVLGTEAAMERCSTLSQGTWQLDPESESPKVTMLGDDVAHLCLPIIFTTGPSGETVEPMRFLMNQVLVRTETGWKISSILPIPALAE